MKFSHLCLFLIFYSGSLLAQTPPADPSPRVSTVVQSNVQLPVSIPQIAVSDGCYLGDIDQRLSESVDNEIINILRAFPAAAIEQYRLNDINDCALASF